VDDAIIPGYGNAEMKAGDTTLMLSIGNPSENTVGLYATLIVDDKQLYRSPLLKPGQGIKSIPLNETLEKGNYDAYVLYQIVDLKNPDTKLNSVRSALELIVK
jgi:ABC-type molybdate transport system substrate-binding protein